MPIDAVQQIATTAARIAPGVEGRVSPAAQAQTAQAFSHVADQESATVHEAPGSEQMHASADGGGSGSGFTPSGRGSAGGRPTAEERPHEDGLGERIDLAA